MNNRSQKTEYINVFQEQVMTS